MAVGGTGTLLLRLYVAGAAPSSRRAEANLRALLEHVAPVECELEVVNILEEPHRALKDHVLLTPTLVVQREAWSLQMVGDLEDRNALASVLGFRGIGD